MSTATKLHTKPTVKEACCMIDWSLSTVLASLIPETAKLCGANSARLFLITRYHAVWLVFAATVRWVGFAFQGARQRLNSLVWPEVMNYCLTKVNDTKPAVAVFDAALLVEAGWADSLHEIWVTFVPEDEVRFRLPVGVCCDVTISPWKWVKRFFSWSPLISPHVVEPDS